MTVNGKATLWTVETLSKNELIVSNTEDGSIYLLILTKNHLTHILEKHKSQLLNTGLNAIARRTLPQNRINLN